MWLTKVPTLIETGTAILKHNEEIVEEEVGSAFVMRIPVPAAVYEAMVGAAPAESAADTATQEPTGTLELMGVVTLHPRLRSHMGNRLAQVAQDAGRVA